MAREIGVDGIVLTMKDPDTHEYLTANVYTVEGIYDEMGDLRLLSIGQLVMAICLQRAAELEEQVIKKMTTMENTSAKLELMTEIEAAVLNDSVNMNSKTVTYNGKTYTYYNFLTTYDDETDLDICMDNVPSTASEDSSDFLTALEAKMDEWNSFSQQTMIELQSLTNKRDQSYDMVSNMLKSLNTVLTGISNNL